MMDSVRVQIVPDWRVTERRRWLVVETRTSGAVSKPYPDEAEARKAAYLATDIPDFLTGEITWASGFWAGRRRSGE
jgi:hypothetical protein